MVYTMEEFAKIDVDALHAGEKPKQCDCGCGQRGGCHYDEMGEFIEGNPIGRPGAVPAAPKKKEPQ